MVWQVTVKVVGADRRTYLTFELSFSFLLSFCRLCAFIGEIKKLMCSLVLVLSQARSFSWLDIGSQDNSASGGDPGQHCDYCMRILQRSSQTFHRKNASMFYCSVQRNQEQTFFLYLCSVTTFSHVDRNKNHKTFVLCLEAFRRSSFCLTLCFRAATCLEVSEGPVVLPCSRRGTNWSSGTPVFSGLLAFFQCKVHTSCWRRGILISYSFLATFHSFSLYSASVSATLASILRFPFSWGFAKLRRQLRLCRGGAESAVSNQSLGSSIRLLRKMWHRSLRIYYFLLKKNKRHHYKGLFNVISKLPVKSAAEWSIPALTAPRHRKGVVHNALPMAFPIWLHWQHLKTEFMQDNCKQKIHLHVKWTHIPIFPALGMDLNVVDVRIQNRDGLGLFSECRRCYWPDSFLSVVPTAARIF